MKLSAFYFVSNSSTIDPNHYIDLEKFENKLLLIVKTHRIVCALYACKETE